MATWKKVIVSGSSANLADLQVDSLTSGEVVIGGGSGNLTTTAVNGTGNIVATTGANNVSMTGSFTGSFKGDGSQLTGIIATDLAFELTGSTGIDSFTFDGSAAAQVAVSGASTLNADTVTKWTGDAFANTNITDDGSQVTINSPLTVSGSTIHFFPDTNFAIYDPATNTTLLSVDVNGVQLNDKVTGNISVDAEQRTLYDSASWNSVDWNNRQLIKSDGTTVAFDWENGSMTGSLNVSGSQVYLKTDDFRVENVTNNTSLIEATNAGVIVYDTTGGQTINAEGRILYDTVTSQSIDWNSRILYDSVESQSIDWNNRYLYNTDGTTVILNWSSSVLLDNTNKESVFWDARKLTKYDGSTAFDWENGQMTGSLNVTGSNVLFKTDYLQVYKGGENITLIDIGAGNVNLFDANGSGSIDVASRLAKDDIEAPSIDWNGRQLIDSASAVSVEWNQRYLNDGAGNNSIAWDERKLIKSDGTTVTVDWETGTFTGSFTGSFVGDGSQLTGVVATVGSSLTEGTGITAFTFDGSSAATVSVSGSAGLSSNTLTKWTGNAFANTTITDDGSLVTFTQDALFQGDIIVQGTASFQNTENLLVADRFVLFASGSTTTGDGGIVVQQGTQNIGEFFGYDAGTVRWGLTSSFNAAGASFAPDAFVAAVIDLQQAGHADVARYQKNGNIKIDNGDIYIYA